MLRGRLPGCAALVLAGLAFAGCSRGGGSGGGSAAVGTTRAAVTAAPNPLTPSLRAEVARELAPQLRYNAYYDDGNTVAQNRSEDYFPMGVASFLREVTSGSARVLVQGSDRHNPGVSELRPFSSAPRLGLRRLEGTPRDMVGDPPGTAPIYVNVYEDESLRSLAPDGSGELVVFAEFWLFYPRDRANARLFGVPTSLSATDITGHRADWEHTAYRARVHLGAGGAYQGATLEEGYYYAHGEGMTVDPADIERVDDLGLLSPQGTHPVVYVAQGKHSSYPQAGEWKDHPPVGQAASIGFSHTDFFRGNGVVIDGWKAPLFDLEAPGVAPDEFAPPELTRLVRASGLNVPLSDWTRYWGNWGEDETRFTAQALSFNADFSVASPPGPKFKPEYHDYGGRGSFEGWRDLKARYGPELRVYRDLGVVIPTVSPPPAPLRR